MGDVSPTILETFTECDSNVVSDALDAVEPDTGGIITGLAPAHPTHTAVGVARPLGFERVTSGEPTNFPFAMLDQITEGEVFVIDADGEPAVSCWGGMASLLAASGGMNGVVVNGGYRDATDIRNGDFPVFGAARTPVTGQRRMRVVSTDEPITVDEVRVAPGDIIVADGTGVAVISAPIAEAVASEAERILEEEKVIEDRIADGATAADLQREGREF